MKSYKVVMLLMAFALVFGILVACSSEEPSLSDAGENGSGGSHEDSEGNNGSAQELSGEITVLTHRTDIVDTYKREYAERFMELHPNVTVHHEALRDYEGDTLIRMSTEDYGDVLMIPNVDADELELFFEPLGTVEELENVYYAVHNAAYEGVVYGIPIAINFPGILYNAAVFEEAGVTELPRTPDEFLAALEQIKENTDAIPLYTNFGAGWPLTQWFENVTVTSGDPDYMNVRRSQEPDKFAQGSPAYQVYEIMYEVANRQLIEPDPLTTDWEESKAMMARGEIATMVLGSWSIPQVKELADNPDDISFMPFPSNASQTIVPLNGDYNIAVNRHSQNKDVALAYLEFFIHESGYAVGPHGGMSTVIDHPVPEHLFAMEELGVQFELVTPTPTEWEGVLDEIDREAEIGFWSERFRQTIIEAGIGHRDESFDDIMADLNQRFNAAREIVLEQRGLSLD